MRDLVGWRADHEGRVVPAARSAGAGRGGRGEGGGASAVWFIWYGIHDDGLQTSPSASSPRRAGRAQLY